ncbi:hypothetical protein F4782DRAFT_551131 [Xylaria castorea]|nr:hypothetical protein F4782DRAFT_551131 [Xylaria castorea]
MKTMMKEMINVCGSPASLARYVNGDAMASARRPDHVVVGVHDMSMYKGVYMLEADGLKVYVFCYSFGYVVTDTHSNLNVVMFEFVDVATPLYESTSKPDILAAEMMLYGGLVYIDAL